MKQFCPKCCKWYDVDERFCPECDVGLYFKKEYNTATNKGKQLKIVSHTKTKVLHTAGIVQLVVGGIIFVLAIILQKILLGILAYFLLTLGALSINTSGYFKRSTPLPTYNQVPNTAQSPIILPEKLTISCPYCKSNNTTKISTISRAGSIFIAGAASGKLGKQWHCNNCNSNF